MKLFFLEFVRLRPILPARVTVLLLSLAWVSVTAAQSWTITSVPFAEHLSIASSADGTALLAGEYGGPIYASTNSGATWTGLTPPLPPDWPSYLPNPTWHGLASSANGQTIAAVSFGGPIWISTNAGATWSFTWFDYNNLQAVACSADGRKLVVVSDNNFGPSPPPPPFSGIYLSSDGGTTWALANAPRLMWFTAASSADGGTLAVGGSVVSGSAVYVSTNAGVTWHATAVPSWFCGRVACSADGTTIIAGTLNESYIPSVGAVFVSTNSGADWRRVDPVPGVSWWGVAVSADGHKIFAGASPGSIYFSTDSGVTWSQTDGPVTNWFAVAASADGNALVAATREQSLNGSIYTLQFAPSPKLELTPSGGNFMVSWTVPSRRFLLQQNPDPGSTNWSDVPTAAVLNYSNLRNELIVPRVSGSVFYRLVGR